MFRSRGDHVVPRYLSAEDEPWVAQLIEVCDAHVGRTVLERRGALQQREKALVDCGVAPGPVVAGVRHVLERQYRSEVSAPMAPPDLRALVFTEAATGASPDYDGALLRASATVQLPVDVVLQSLFADRQTARRLLPSERTLSPAAVVEAYDLALVESVLLRAESVTVELREHVRAIARFARRAGLICTFTPLESGGRFEVSGPLAVLRATTRYGHALCKFFGALATTASYSLQASCVIDGERIPVRVADADRSFGPATTSARMLDLDTPVERALQRDLARIDRGWQLRRSDEGSVLAPDFELVSESSRVYVEIVEDVGAEYLASRAATLPADALLCVEERVPAPELIARTVLRYRKRIDPMALIAAAEQLARGL